MEVAWLVREGLSDREVAERLHVARRTAEWHVEQILMKLDLKSRAQLAAAIAEAEAAKSPGLGDVRSQFDLPLQLSAFIGRESELERLGEKLRTSRLMTLVGTAGVGKTRLALEVAPRLLAEFPSGAWFVDLAPVRDPALAPRAVASVLQVVEQPRTPLADSLVERLRKLRALLLLDNCEHVLDEIAPLAEAILRNCPGVTLLATSREPLRVPGEVAWRVEPLEVPQPRRRYSTAELDSMESVRLFVDRAQHVAPGLLLSDENGSAVAELCRRLDGLPLGIELAAARASVMTPTEILERLVGADQLGATGSRTAPPRHKTMRAAIDWSHQLLTRPAALLFRRLSVFAGSFSLEAAEAVAGQGLHDGSLLTALSELVDKSLVVAVRQSGSRTRYRLLESLREYARERLLESGEASEVAEAHLNHFLEFAEPASARLTHDGLEMLAEIDVEQDNLRVAFEEALRRKDGTAIRFALRLFHYWSIRGHIVEGRELLSRALEDETAAAADRCLGFAFASHFAWLASDWKSAIPCAERAIEIGETLEPTIGLTVGLWALGMQRVNRLDLEAAETLFVRSLKSAHEDGTDWSLCYPLSGIYTIRMMSGDRAGVAALEADYYGRFDEKGFPYLHCLMRCVSALLHAVAGDYEEARHHLEIGLRLASRWGAYYWGGWGVRTAAYLAAEKNDLANCWRLYGASDVLRDNTHFRVRGPGRQADDILGPAREALDAASIEDLVRQGKSMTAAEAFRLAAIVSGIPGA